jgi:putative endonuclease
LGVHHGEQAVRYAVHRRHQRHRRSWQHKNDGGSAFCKRHGLTRLVYAEEHPRIIDAIAREKAMKAWKRNWKLRQIIEANPDWDDLFEKLNH